MTGRLRAGPRRGASISRPAAVIFHARVESDATSTRPSREQHERGGHEVGPAVPRSRAHGGDPAGAHGLAAMLVLSIAQGGEDDALLGGHDPSKLAPRPDAGNRAVPDPLVCEPACRACSPDRPRENPMGERADAERSRGRGLDRP
jgi:hypothetical protein